MSTDYNDWKEKQKCFKGIQNYHKECKSMTNGLPRNLKVTVNCSKFDKKKTYKAAIKLHHKKIRLKKKQKKNQLQRYNAATERNGSESKICQGRYKMSIKCLQRKPKYQRNTKQLFNYCGNKKKKIYVEVFFFYVCK